LITLEGPAMTDPVETLRSYEQRVQEITERAGATRARLAALRPAATSPDGAVTVTVSSTGALVDLAFGPAAERIALPDLARLVVATAQTARSEAARQTEAAVAELVGSDTARRAMGPPPTADERIEPEDESGDQPGYRGRGYR
jgi:DNA-binding protein YbaB